MSLLPGHHLGISSLNRSPLLVDPITSYNLRMISIIANLIKFYLSGGPMNSSPNKEKRSVTSRNLSRSVVKLSAEEVNTFLTVFTALMQQTPCPKDARKCYLMETKKRLHANGVEFLSKARVFPTLGLKLLGKDLTGFPVKGFKKQAGQIYPRY
jgi:hypothetical protein